MNFSKHNITKLQVVNMKTKCINTLKRVSTEGHEIRKRPAHKFERYDCVVYVGNISNIKGLSAKCDKLIRNGKNEIRIHCMGTAISKGILLALQVCKDNMGYRREVTTSTVELVDDLVPTNDEEDYEVSRRNNKTKQYKDVISYVICK